MVAKKENETKKEKKHRIPGYVREFLLLLYRSQEDTKQARVF